MGDNADIISVKFHDFDVKGDCLADVVLTMSDTTIQDLKVKQGLGGGVIVHMPTWMHTSWAFPEIEWADVRKEVVKQYKSVQANVQVPQVLLHDYDSNGNCLADIILPESGIHVTALKVMQGPGGGIMVHMPAWMHTRWSYPEIQWATVRQLITEKFKSSQQAGKCDHHAEQGGTTKEKFEFYSKRTWLDTSISVQRNGLDERVGDIHLMSNSYGQFKVYAPSDVITNLCSNGLTWDEIETQIINAFQECRGESPNFYQGDLLYVFLDDARKVDTYLVDVILPHKKNTIKGFKLKASDTIRISTPSWMGRWNDPVCSWQALCDKIIGAFKEYTGEITAIPQEENICSSPAEIYPSPSEDRDFSVDEKISREKNEYGRIKNAENSSLKFYPHTVLRVVEKDDSPQQKKKLFDLITALSKGSLGGIGPFEINILDWVDRLKHVTSTMLMDLIRGGYVATGWRKDVTQNKLPKIISRMSQYDLVALTRFVTVDENGLPITDSHSIMRILTLGKSGSTLLHELGHNTTHYNAFNIFQDGNTVKRYLAANQWLIYWLTTFPSEVCENYETSTVIYQKGSDFSGARIYAALTCNECTLVAEPLRRVEAFEHDSNEMWLRHKFLRFVNLFSHLDELYAGQNEISFNERPIIVYLCEDDNHINEIWEALKDLILNHPEQEVWFSTDLRIFNYDMKGQRFLHCTEEGSAVVDIAERLGVSE